MKTLVIVGCSSRKLAVSCPAKVLYSPSQLFRAGRAFAEREGSAGWLIVSARHGLIDPDTVLAPYGARLPANGEDLRGWQAGAQADFAGWLLDRQHFMKPGRGTIPSTLRGLRVVVLAGREYVEALKGTGLAGIMEAPLQGLQIGERLQYLGKAKAAADLDGGPLFSQFALPVS